MKTKVFSTVMFILWMSLQAYAQNWEWKWGGIPSSPQASPNWATPLFTDREGTIYAMYSNMQNAELASFDPDGNFKNGIFFSTTFNSMIFESEAAMDTSGNLYLAITHQAHLYLMDTLLLHSTFSIDFMPELVIVKIGADQKIKWCRSFPCTSQTTLHELIVARDQNIVVSALHMTNSGQPQQVICFGDTVSFTSSTQLIHKIDPSGNPVWSRSIVGESLDQQAFMLEDSGQRILLMDFCNNDLMIGADTILFPPDPMIPFRTGCLIRFDSQGNYLGGTMMNNGIHYMKMALDENNNSFFAGSYNRAFLGGDSLIAPQDSMGNIIYCSGQDLNLIWKKSFTTKYSTMISIASDDDRLWFAANLPQHANVFGKSVSFIGAQGVMTGLLGNNGDLLQYILSPVFYKFLQNQIITDNCGNIVMGAFHTGWGIIGSDTLYSSGGSGSLIAYLQTQAPLSTSLPSDTTACGSLVLRLSPEFTHFNWNNGASAADSLVVTENGVYVVEAATENHCWVNDTVFVEIHELPGNMLGYDKTISKKDSLILQIPVSYMSCRWSTGDTTSSVTFRGEELGTGSHTIWVTVEDPPCTVTDTVKINVVPNPGIAEPDTVVNWFYPNPARGTIIIDTPETGSLIMMVNPEGKTVRSCSFSNPDGEKKSLDTRGLKPGLYFLIEKTDKRTRRGVVVISDP